MPGLYEKLTFVAGVALAVLASVRSSPVVGPEPIRCAPCSEEKLNSCPAIPADCKQVLREPGCGCCMACALERGASCGIHTAHCGEGLRCTARPGEARPLHALTRGQGVCTEDLGQGNLSFSRFKCVFTVNISYSHGCKMLHLQHRKPYKTGYISNTWVKKNSVLKHLFYLHSGNRRSPRPRLSALPAGSQPSL